MTRELLQKAYVAMDGQWWAKDLCRQIENALAAPMPEPVAWRYKKEGGGWYVSDNEPQYVEQWNDIEEIQPLYTAPPAAPAPAVCDGGTCGLGGYCANCPRQSAAPARPDEFTCPYCFDQGAAPVVPDIANPITDEQIIEAASNWDCGTRHENEEWAFKRPRELLQFARAVLALSAAPVVREPIIDEMDAVASKYAHKLALDLECVLSDYNGKWWDTAMQTIGGYRSAMNAIHERESPTHMGEPVLPKHGIGGGGK